VSDAIELLDLHFDSFVGVRPYADKYGHPHPTDTRGWSQIVVSALSGISGLKRKKGSDLIDGSDVKAANTWDAIDTPRFNGCIKSGTKSSVAGSMQSLDRTPHLFFVLWDTEPTSGESRVRIWVVRPPHDQRFRAMASLWYQKRKQGVILSDNFQLHPPRNKNSNVFTNTCGNLKYPLLFEARRRQSGFECVSYHPAVLDTGNCEAA
jgi:hypothetical protein